MSRAPRPTGSTPASSSASHDVGRVLGVEQQLDAVLARVARAADQQRHAGDACGCSSGSGAGRRPSASPSTIARACGPWTASMAKSSARSVTSTSKPSACATEVGEVLVVVGGVGDGQEVALGEPVGEEVVDDAAVLEAGQRVLGAALGDPAHVVGQQVLEELGRLRPAGLDLAHVADVEHAGALRARPRARRGCRPGTGPASPSRRTGPAGRRRPRGDRTGACGAQPQVIERLDVGCTMNLRSFAVAALLAFPATASAQDVKPLTGTGENVAPIARIAVPGANEIALAGDWAFVSTDAAGGGLRLPVHRQHQGPGAPVRRGHLGRDEDRTSPKQSYGDVDISPDGKLAVLTNAHGARGRRRVGRDPRHPRQGAPASSLSVDQRRRHDGLRPHEHAGQQDAVPQPAGVRRLSAARPRGTSPSSTSPTRRKPSSRSSRSPRRRATSGLAHDTYVDHRPDGKTLMYAASISQVRRHRHHRPAEAHLAAVRSRPRTRRSPTTCSPTSTARSSSSTTRARPAASSTRTCRCCGKLGQRAPRPIDSGSLHFYAAAADGTFANNGAVAAGHVQRPAELRRRRDCVAHVFWQAPDENRLTQAYYNGGAWVDRLQRPRQREGAGQLRRRRRRSTGPTSRTTATCTPPT